LCLVEIMLRFSTSVSSSIGKWIFSVHYGSQNLKLLVIFKSTVKNKRKFKENGHFYVFDVTLKQMTVDTWHFEWMFIFAFSIHHNIFKIFWLILRYLGTFLVSNYFSILDSEWNDECIDFTIMYILFFLFIYFFFVTINSVNNK